MPVRDAEPYVALALHSLLDQSVRDIEILVVDDDSHDGTVGEVRRVADERVCIISGDGQGVSAARNCGIRSARGLYVAFMDGDDTCSLERLERQMVLLEAMPEVVAVGTSYSAIDDRGQHVTVVPHLSRPDDVETAMYSFNPFCGASLMVRRAALVEIGGYDESLQLGEDYDLCARLLVTGSGRLANIVDPLYQYRWHGDSTSKRRREELDGSLTGIRDRIWELRPPASPSWRQLTRGRSPRADASSRELRRLRASAYLQLGAGLLRRRRPLHAVRVVGMLLLVSPTATLGLILGRLPGLRPGGSGGGERLRRFTAYALRIVVRSMPPRGKGARLVAAVNKVVSAPVSTMPAKIAPDVVLSCNVRDSIGWRIFYRGEFEPALTRLLVDELRAGDTFLDVGANCGYYTLLAARRVGAAGRVHAFEPARAIVDRLLADVTRNGFSRRIEVHAVAVGAAPGTAVLEPGADRTSAEGTRHLATQTHPHGTETVEIVAVDTVLAGQRVDVVKIDIEGYEEQALLGMRQLLKDARPRLVVVEAVESHLARFGSSVSDLVALMEAVGYRHSLLSEPGYDDVLVFRPSRQR